MELTPTAVSQATFRITRKGFEPDEVRRYLVEVSRALEAAQQQSSAMEARARAALAKLHEASQVPSGPSPDEAQAISRALLLAQRTADATIADADRRAGEILAAATAQSDEARRAARAEATSLVETARADARRARDEEYLRAENEVQALLARRDFLVADVEQLEQHLAAHRQRLCDVADELRAMADRSDVGLGDLRRPLLSASEGVPAGERAAHDGETAGRDETAAFALIGADDVDGEPTDPTARRASGASDDPLLSFDDR